MYLADKSMKELETLWNEVYARRRNLDKAMRKSGIDKQTKIYLEFQKKNAINESEYIIARMEYLEELEENF